MNIPDFLKAPMFPAPDSTYLSLAEFSPAAPPAKMEQDIDAAIAQLNHHASEFSSSETFTNAYLALISQAEAQAAGKQWPEAHKTVWEATFLINRARESNASAKFRKWMCAYYGVWLLLLVGIGYWLKHLDAAGNPVVYFGSTYWRYLLMGTLGGLTIAIWGLTSHAANLDFDRSYAIWYWLRPLLGAVMGLIAVIAVQAGLLAVEGQAAHQPAPSGKLLLYILAFLAGFSERFFIRVIDRVMTAIFSSEPAPAPAAKPVAPKKQ